MAFAFAAFSLVASVALAQERQSRQERPRRRSKVCFEEGQVSLFGNSLRLGVVLDQLARNHSCRLVVRKEINLKRDVDVPTLKNVTLRDALRVILSPVGYSFAFEDGDLVIFASYTQIFRVNVPMLTQYWVTSISNEAAGPGGQGGQGGGGQAGAGGAGAGGAQAGGGARGGGGGGAQGAQSGLGGAIGLTSISSSEGFWEELETSLEAFIGSGGKASVNRSAGLVVVNDSPENLEAVGRYIDTVNEEMARQSVVEIRVLEFTSRERMNAGVDWSALFQRLGGSGLNLGLRSDFASRSVAAASNAPGTTAVSLSGVSGSAVLQALEDQGEIQLVAQPNLLVGNNLPAIIQVGQVQGYIAQVSTTAEDGAISTEVEQGILSDGLTMSLLPRIQDDSNITMSVSVVLQEILSIDTRSFGGNTNAFSETPILQIDLPTLNRRGYNGTISAGFGDTLVIGGLIQRRKENNSAGLPFLAKVPIVGILFGAQEARDDTSELLILITPKRLADGAKPDPVYMERFLDPVEE
ncbi:MAG: hypothetical protein AAFU77_17500 [Myxococcota bacterium]